jgi:hypothetical protein
MSGSGWSCSSRSRRALRDAGEIERDIAAFARSSNGGVIVTASPRASRHRDLIVTLAARHRLPAVYASAYFVTDGDLISYGASRLPVPSVSCPRLSLMTSPRSAVDQPTITGRSRLAPDSIQATISL